MRRTSSRSDQFCPSSRIALSASIACVLPSAAQFFKAKIAAVALPLPLRAISASTRSQKATPSPGDPQGIRQIRMCLDPSEQYHAWHTGFRGEGRERMTERKAIDQRTEIARVVCVRLFRDHKRCPFCKAPLLLVIADKRDRRGGCPANRIRAFAPAVLRSHTGRGFLK